MARRRASKRRSDFLAIVADALSLDPEDVTEKDVLRLLARGPQLDTSLAEDRILVEHYYRDGWQLRVRAWSKPYPPWIEERNAIYPDEPAF